MKRLALRSLSLLARESAGRKFLAPGSLYSMAHRFLRSREFHQSSARCIVKPYLLADIGEGITECQIICWFVKPGDFVEQFGRICEVQSDKATVEITSRWDGTIRSLRYEVDDMAIVGQPLLDIDTDEIEGVDIPKESAENKAMIENMVPDEIQERAAPEPKISETPRAGPSNTTHPSNLLQSTKAQDSGLIPLIPSVRHMLNELNIDAAEIQGTGRNGRISKEDVQRYHSAKLSQLSSISSTLAPLPASIILPADTLEDRLMSLTPTENMMFKSMTRSLKTPHFLYTHSVDLTSVNTLRKRLKVSRDTRNCPKLTPLPFILKAISEALKQMPRLNAHLDTDTSPQKPQFLLKGKHNFGIAVNTPQGLLVPVIKEVQARSISSLAEEIQRLGTLAKEGKLGVDDFKGATFTVSNIGSIGGDVVGPIIVPPQVCTVGIGRMQAMPRYEKDEETGKETLIRKEEVVLSWSADHRVLDGATVARCAEVVGSFVSDLGALGIVLK